MSEIEKELLAQALKEQLTGTGRTGPSLVSDYSVISPDIVPFAVAACAATTHLHRPIDDALREADPAWDTLASDSALLRHAALTVLPSEDAVYAYRLTGVVRAARQDHRARACLEDIVRHGWRRVWQTVRTGGDISLERFRELHPSEPAQGIDAELVILVWYAGVCNVPVARSPAREALDVSLLHELHRLTMLAAGIDPASRSRYGAAVRYVRAWRRATGGNGDEHELAAILAGARDIVGQMSQTPDTAMPVQGDVWQTALLLAGGNAGLDDGTAVSMLTGLFALRRGSAAQHPAQAGSALKDRSGTQDEELRHMRTELAAQQREAHRLAAELNRARECLSVRDAENSRLRRSLAVRNEPEPEIQYAMKIINERILVAGGHETTLRNLQVWLPNSVCIATNGKEDLDRSVLAGVRLVVVLTSYISHSFSGMVVSEAHKRNVPICYVDWHSPKLILREIDQALTAQTEAPDR